MPCAVFVPCYNPSRVFLQLASQIAEGSSPVWFCKVFSLLWVSLSALQPPVKRLEASPSLLASFWYSNLHLPLFPSCAECSCLLNSLGTAPPKSKPPVSHLVRMETCWFWLEWSCRGSNCFFCRVPTNPALLSFNYIPFGRPFMASSSRVFTEFQDGNWRAPCLSTQHLMGILFQFSLIWKLNFTLSICFLASKVLLISLLFFF